jgi:hypothetical protein
VVERICGETLQLADQQLAIAEPPVRQVIAATLAGARLVPGAPAMLGVLEAAARDYQQQRGSPERLVDSTGVSN